MAVGTAYNMHMLLAHGLIKEAGCEGLVWGNCLVTYRADAGNSGFAFWVTMRTTLYSHELIRNLHGAVDFGNKLFAHKKLRLAYRTLYRLHI